MRIETYVLIVGLAALPGRLPADELAALTREYRQACTKVRGAPKDRAAQVSKHVAPVLKRIGAVDTDASLKFLVGELDGAPVPEIAAACAEPILASSNSRALSLLLSRFERRPGPVQKAILVALTSTKKDISTATSEILRAGASPLPADVKRYLPGVLAKLDTVESARLLLSHVRDRKPRGRDTGDESAYRSSVVTALKGTKSDAVKVWLAKEAFKVARSSSGRLELVARLAGELKLEGARDDLTKLVAHRSTEVAAAAVDALVRIGVGDAVDAIASALERRRGKGDLTFRIQALDALALSGSETALQVVLRFAGSKDPEARAIAMGSLVHAAQQRGVLKALVGGLEDSDPSVRSVTLQALGRVRHKAVIAPLIEALANQKDPSFQVKVLELLINFTGQNFGPVVVDWRKWWSEAEATFEFPTGKEAGKTKVRAYDLDYFGIEVSSKRLGFLVDRSSSMTQMVPVTAGSDDEEEETGRTRGPRKPGGDGKLKTGKARKIDVLKYELVRVIKKLTSDTFVNIVCFDAAYRPWQKQLQPLRGTGRAKAVSFVENLNTGRGTNVFDTLEFALKDKRLDTIYLLSDGLPTRGRITDPEAILREIATQNRVRGVTIHCIAFGEESSLLERLAAQNGGEYRFVNRYDKL